MTHNNDVVPIPVSVDVLIVGAGLSGIGTACYLTRERPQDDFLILEARAESGGTWDKFRYPGIRSDSDLFTFGYEFRPWSRSNAIAAGGLIRSYIRDTAAEYGIDEHIVYNTKVLAADWDSESARWTITAERAGQTITVTARWFVSASGYYDHDRGHSPSFPGQDDFAGTIVHPQDWPEDLDYADKRVVVIGSGATAVTLVPALAGYSADTGAKASAGDDAAAAGATGPSGASAADSAASGVRAGAAAHVTMLQRSPTFVLPTMTEDPADVRLQRWLPAPLAARATRYRHIVTQRMVWRNAQDHPDEMRAYIRAANAEALPADYPIDEHFSPSYNPWEQRLCFVPGADMFQAISAGAADVVTDTIDTFVPDSIRLSSGRVLPADIIITATGLELIQFGGIRMSVDGRAVDLPATVAYRGCMLSGVPNFLFAMGYLNNSWTLKLGPLCRYWLRLLAAMDERGADVAVPDAPAAGTELTPMNTFAAGYVQRAQDTMPRAGLEFPWTVPEDYTDDRRILRGDPTAEPHLHLGPARVRARRARAAAD
ncbi:NAD(P)/FAD-dependent oxidoreductase [Brevibacterium sp. 91QC2O2]|uniref:flavin-containing monooxygenase n=1 Tax=Brevibacterium sp. 91QC2O2 TaxID=2968458 RepID=UPI00211BB5A1|nr:NAD(P)/FAD-dependent oxidoreductase [Brevibacterium sp. 91QC2O2]MCQ9368149.1 NAD(P)/FAD-dependent oxidoreductase [Brevibacterium sp. 91QC2O2]